MRALSALVGVLVLWASSAGAQIGSVFNRSGSGARAAGMANAFIAISDDGTAASWNPAGLGQLRKPEFSIVTTTSRRDFRSRGFRTRDDLAIYSPAAVAYTSSYIDFASLAVPLTLARKPVTFQVAWRRLYTLDFRESVSISRTPLDPAGPAPLLFEGDSDVVGGFSLVSMAGAVKLTPRLALGATFNLWRGDWTENQALGETSPESSAPPRFATLTYSNRVRGHNVSLGLLLTYPRWSVGLLHQGAARGDFAGTAAGRTSFDPQPVAEAASGKSRFSQAVGLGVAWRPASRWTVGFDLTWDQWSHTLLALAGAPSTDLFTGLPPELSATRDTLSASLGAERLVQGDGFVVPIRFGVALEPQGPRSPYTRDPVNFVMLAAGTGYNTNSLKFDAALQYRWASFRDGASIGLEPGSLLLPAAVGERRAGEWRMKLSVIWRLTDTEKLHGLLRKVFGGG